MSGPRITVASGTPAPSRREAAAFCFLVLPAIRERPSWLDVTCIGDVLDTPSDGCLVRTWRHKPSTGDFWFVARPCKKLTCPYCVVDALTRTAGAAWGYWHGRANVVELEDEDRRKRIVAEFGVRFRKDAATAGALSVPTSADTQVLFWPGRPSPPGAELRGAMLGRELVKALRAVPVEEKLDPGDRERSETAGAVPREVTDAEVRQMASEVTGSLWDVFRGGWGHMPNVTPEERAEIIDRLWQIARSR